MFELIMGLEVHVQLNTITKLFCGCKTSFGEKPNSNTCPVCIGLPGALPVVNKEAVIKAMKFGNAIHAKINDNSIFERKNYFYPDLPTSYQISQLQIPIVEGGYLIVKTNNKEKTIRINRAHLETDAGKNIHETNNSYVDLNRAGTPLLEIVTEPDFRSVEEVTSYLKQLHSIVKYLDISDANMQEGSFRCDVNISIRPKGDTKLYTRCEIKNLNSFKFIEKAIVYEFERQVEAWEDGVYEKEVIQETRQFDTNKFITKSMRGKEEAMDYRYFPDPDLKPIKLLPEMYEIAEQLPEMPVEKTLRYKERFGLNDKEIERLVQDVDTNKVFEILIGEDTSETKLKTIITLLLVELQGYLNNNEIVLFDVPLHIEQLRTLVELVENDTVSMSAGKNVLFHLLENQYQKTSLGKSLIEDVFQLDIDQVLDELNLKQISDTTILLDYINKVLSGEEDSVAEYRAGKDKLFGSFVGKVMKATGGKGNPQMISQLLKQTLGA
jgi:aspartyl-tRNA(Asn)/glutamyl-tRNA(Gln) amidotransferase subunit B